MFYVAGHTMGMLCMCLYKKKCENTWTLGFGEGSGVPLWAETTGRWWDGFRLETMNNRISLKGSCAAPVLL
jgi:hypothetical protein